MDLKIERFLFKHSSLIKLFLISLLIPSLVFFLKALTYDYYPDFSVYYASKIFLEGVNPYFLTSQPVHFVYSPSVILLLLSFSLLPLFLAQKLFVIFSMFCFFTSVFILFKLFRVSFFSHLGIFFLILLLNYFPEKFTLGMGQLNNVMLLGTVLFLFFYQRKKDHISGLFLAIPIVIKFFPILLIIYLIFKRRINILLSLSAGFILITLISFIVVGATENFYFYQKVMPNLLGGFKNDYYNQAISGFLARQINNPTAVDNIKNISAALLTILTMLIVWKKRKNKKLELISIGTLITLSLIINAYSWQHHFVFLLIPFFITFFHIKNNNLNPKYYLILAISYALVALNLEEPFSFPLLIQSHVLFGSIILYVLAIYFLVKPQKAS